MRIKSKNVTGVRASVILMMRKSNIAQSTDPTTLEK